MAYYNVEEMKKTLDGYSKFQERLYCKGFLITNDKQNVSGEYPFYSNWKERSINEWIYMYTHNETSIYTYEERDITYCC